MKNLNEKELKGLLIVIVSILTVIVIVSSVFIFKAITKEPEAVIEEIDIVEVIAEETKPVEDFIDIEINEDIVLDEEVTFETILNNVDIEEYVDAYSLSINLKSEEAKRMSDSLFIVLDEEAMDYTSLRDMILFMSHEDIIVRYYLNSDNTEDIIYLDSSEIILSKKKMIHSKSEIDSIDVPFLNSNFLPSDTSVTKFYMYEIYTDKFSPTYELYITVAEGDSKVYYGRYRKNLEDGEYHNQNDEVIEFYPTEYKDY